MNLLAPNPQAHLLRCNMLRLLVSERQENQHLALQMMEAGGVPLVALRELRKLLKGHSQRYPGPRSNQEEAQLDRLLTSGMATLPPEMQVWLAAWWMPDAHLDAPTKVRMAWEQRETFELSVKLGLMTWEQWADCWNIDGSLLRETCLTGLLLDMNMPLEREGFLRVENEGHFLRKPWLAKCFERFPDDEFQLQILTRLVTRSALNLSGTALKTLPAIADRIPGINEIDLSGTSISQLPIGLLHSVPVVIGKRRQKLQIAVQALQSGDKTTAMRHQELLRRGKFAYDEGNVPEAHRWFRGYMNSVPSTRWMDLSRNWNYGNAFFGSAVESGDWEMAVEVLQAMASLQWRENPAMNWPSWQLWRGLILAAGTEELFYPALEILPLRNVTPRQFFCFHWPHGWADSFERVLYRRGLDDAFRFLDRAARSLPELRLSMFRWDRILAHLKHIQRPDLVLQLFEYLDGPGAWLILDPTQKWAKDPRTLQIGHDALRKLGATEALERYQKLKANPKR